MSEEKRLKRYIQGNFKVSHIRNSDVVELSFTSNNPELAKFLLTRIIESYLRYDVDAKITVTAYANRQINLRLSELLINMEKAEKNLLNYKKENKKEQKRSAVRNSLIVYDITFVVWNGLNIPVPKTMKNKKLPTVMLKSAINTRNDMPGREWN